MVFEDPLFSTLLVLAGSLALFLIGLRFLSESLQQLGEKRIFKAIGGMHSLSSSIVSGTITSFFVQSRLSTSLMASSYGTSGLFSLSQLIGFLLGANIGATVILWLFVFNWKMVTLVFIVSGVFLKIYSSKDKLTAVGHLLFAIGLLLLGQWMIQLLVPMSTLLTFSLRVKESWIELWPILGIFVAMTIVVRSSVAMVALTMVLTMVGIVGFKLAIILVICIQLGSVIPALTESWSASWRARAGQSYLLLAHLVLGSVSLLFIEIFFDQASLVSKLFVSEGVNEFTDFFRADVVMLPAIALLYNLLLAIIFGLLFKPFRNLFLDRAEKSRPKELQKLKLVGQSLLVSPVLGIDLATQETMKMAAMIESLLIMTKDLVFNSGESEVSERINKYERITDNISDEVSLFITKLLEIGLSPNQGQKLKALTRMVSDLESIADHCKSIALNFQEGKKSGEVPNQETLQTLHIFYDEVLVFYESIFSDFTDIAYGQKTAEHKDEMKEQSQNLELTYLKTMEQMSETSGYKPPTRFCRELLISLNQIQIYALSIHDSFH